MVECLIGVDIVDINRFRLHSICDHERFYKQIFNEYELQYCMQFSDPYPHLAGIFAAKEATFKAIHNFLKLKISDISVYHDKQGKPIIMLKKIEIHQSAMEILEDNDDEEITIQISISHTAKIAIAWAVMLKNIKKNNKIELYNDILTKTRQVVHNGLKYGNFSST